MTLLRHGYLRGQGLIRNHRIGPVMPKPVVLRAVAVILSANTPALAGDTALSTSRACKLFGKWPTKIEVDTRAVAVRSRRYIGYTFGALLAVLFFAVARADELPTTVNPHPGPPVTINRCEAWTTNFYDLTLGEEFYFAGVGIKFTNDANSAVIGLTLEVSAYDKSNVLLPKFPWYFNTGSNRAAAKMSVPPGASFSLLGKVRNWQLRSNLFEGSDHVECSIALVMFDDGSVWRAPNP